MTPPREPATWCSVLQPSPVEPPADPLATVAALADAAEMLQAADDPGVRVVGARIAEWLQRGGDLPRLLGVRGRRGQRAVHARQRQQHLMEIAHAAAVTTGERTITGQAVALARLIEGDTPLGRELRSAGVARSPRHLRRVLAAGQARHGDTSS